MDYLTELVGRPAGLGQRLASDLRHDGRQPRRALPARAAATSSTSSARGGSAPTTIRTPSRTRPMGLSEFNMTYFRRTILMPILHLLPDTSADHAARLGQRPVPAHRPAGRGDQGGRRRAIVRSTSSPTSWCRTGRSSSRRTGGCLEPEGVRGARRAAGLRRAGRLRRHDHRGPGDDAAGRGPARAGRADPGRRGADPRARPAHPLAGRDRRGAADQVRHPERLPLPRTATTAGCGRTSRRSTATGCCSARCSASTCRSSPTGCSPSRTTCSIYELPRRDRPGALRGARRVRMGRRPRSPPC